MGLTKKPFGDILFNWIVYALSGIVLLIVIYPLYFIVIASFSEPSAVAGGKMWLYPYEITFDGYKELFRYPDIWVGYKNTLLYTFAGTFIGLTVNIPAAYALSRKDLVGNRLLTLFYIFTLFFNGGLIPTYLTIHDFHLYDTFTVMVLPFSVAVYNIIVARAFFTSSIPPDLWDASRIDGCGNLQFFSRIVLPLSKAIIAVIGLWTAVGHWNSYFNALIYINRKELYPLQLVLRNILVINQVQAQIGSAETINIALRIADLLRYTVIIAASVPIICVYPFIQKHFNQGVMIGAVKG